MSDDKGSSSSSPSRHFMFDRGGTLAPTALGLRSFQHWSLQHHFHRLRPPVRPYTYPPLPARNCIRIFSLHAGPHDAPLTITPEIITSPEETLYEAISYVWGNPDNVESLITHDGFEIRVTKNLGDALRAFRRLDTARTLWADAICIDQQNPAERNRQVRRMATIYEQAETTLVWIGPVSTTMARLTSAVEAVNEWHDLPTERSDRDHPLIKSLDIESLVELGSATWFHRVWTMQEVGLARKAILYCREESNHQSALCQESEVQNSIFGLDWHRVYRAFLFAPKRSIVPSLLEKRFSSLTRNLIVLHEWQTSTNSALELLESVRSRGATDSRDRVFALLSHRKAWFEDRRSRRSRPMLEPDYTKSWPETYRMLAENMIISQANLDVLSYVDWQNIANRCPLLPTWVPDWNQQKLHERIVYLSLFIRFDACGREKAPDLPEAFWHPRFGAGGVLSTFGHRIGSIVWQSGTLRAQDFPEPGERWCKDEHPALFNALEYLQSADLASNSVNLEDLIIRTLLCGSTTAWKMPLSEKSMHIYRRAVRSALMVEAMDVALHEASEERRLPAGISKEDAESAKAIENFLREARLRCNFRNLFLTDTGYLGLGPPHIIIGYEVFILRGGRVPYVLAPATHANFPDTHGPSPIMDMLAGHDVSTNEHNYYKLAAECYVDGVMYGEVANQRSMHELHII